MKEQTFKGLRFSVEGVQVSGLTVRRPFRCVGWVWEVKHGGRGEFPGSFTVDHGCWVSILGRKVLNLGLFWGLDETVLGPPTLPLTRPTLH